MKLSKSITLLGACAAFIWVACNGDSSDSVGSAGLSADMPILKLDEKARTISFYHDSEEELCVLDTVARTASRKTVITERDTTYARYEFVTLPENVVNFIRDTLKISVNGNTALSLIELPEKDYYEEYSLGLYVGGSSSNIKGAWISVPCEVDEGEVTCYNRSEWLKITLTISSNSLHASGVGFRSEDGFGEYTDDISQSGFVVSLYAFLRGVSSSIEGGYGAFYDYSEDMSELIDEFEIDVKSKSKNSETFVMDGKSYGLKANQFVMRENEVYIDLTISADGKSCSYFHERAYMDEGAHIEKTCKTEYYKYYDREYAEDKNGRRFVYAARYEKDNGKEFKECLEKLSGLEHSGTMFYSSLMKMSEKKKTDSEFWREYNRNMHYLLRKFK